MSPYFLLAGVDGCVIYLLLDPKEDDVIVTTLFMYRNINLTCEFPVFCSIYPGNLVPLDLSCLDFLVIARANFI